MAELVIPKELLPVDGRFGCGPSKVRPEALASVAGLSKWMGTSHRQEPVRAIVREVRARLTELFSLPDGYEVAMGNGGATLFWDAAAFSLVERHSAHAVFGEFSSKFADVCKNAPTVDTAEVFESEPGTLPHIVANDTIDTYCLTHNETSTGVMAPVRRPEDADNESFVLVDATSGAGGLRVDPREFDVYYFSPQKCFSSDGGLWAALLSPAAVNRIQVIASSNRWIPPSLSVATALEQSRLDQTYNTPALATIWLLNEQLGWMLDNGGLEWSASRSDTSAERLYGWAEASEFATPFVSKPDERSRVVGTIDFTSTIDAKAVSAVLRANGIVDTESYRKLGRNQLRVGMFPAVDPDDVSALCACIDYVINHL